MYERILLSEPKTAPELYRQVCTILTQDSFELLTCPLEQLADFALSGCNPHLAITWVFTSEDMQIITDLHQTSSLPLLAGMVQMLLAKLMVASSTKVIWP